MMNDSDMEIVSRYIDGELSVDERASFEARLVDEPALEAALEEALKLDAELKTTFHARGTDSVPPRIAAMLGAPADNVVAFPARPRKRVQFAIAASVAAVCGVLITQNMQNSEPGLPELLQEDRLLSQALESTPSMATGWETLADGRQLRPVLTFPSTAGSWCREYLLSTADNDWRGVACRDADGAWITEALGSESFLNPGDAYQPAGAGDSDQVATFIGENAADIALSRGQEADVMANNWQ
jgi:surface antigen